MSFKIPTFCKVLAKFGPFFLLGGKLSVSASHRFSRSDNLSTSVRTAVQTTFFPKTEIFVKVLKYLSEQRYPLTSPYTMTKRTNYYSLTTGGQATLTVGGTTGATYRKIMGTQNPEIVRIVVRTQKKGKKPKIE